MGVSLCCFYDGHCTLSKMYWQDTGVRRAVGKASHRLLPVLPGGADLICTSVEFGLGLGNPLVQALPPLLLVPFSDAPGMKGVLEVFFDEALTPRRTLCRPLSESGEHAAR
jgi:hypothetical protein